MSHNLRKPFSALLSFLLIFEQFLPAGRQVAFAQVSSQIDVSRYFTQLSQGSTQDKFRPLHLRYLSYDNITNSFKLLLDRGDFFNQKTEKPKNRKTVEFPNSSTLKLEEATQELLKYFFIGLSLPNEKFWVNLRPDSENQIIDDDLAMTDVGKILLEADLQLKKDTAQFTSPQTKEGKVYWDKLYQKAGELFGIENLTIPTLTRPWIVPNEIIVRETSTSAYIYKATLKVMLEEDYLKSPQSTVSPQTTDHSPQYNFSDPRLKQLNEYSTQLIRETIIPKLTYEVNTAKRYAPLRQIYYSLILAQWFKARYRSPQSTVYSPQSNPYLKLIDSRDLTNLTSKVPYDKQAYFKQYQKSFRQGEYNLKEPVYTVYGQSLRSYLSGGLYFAKINIPLPGQTNETSSSIIGSLKRIPHGTRQEFVDVSVRKVSEPAEVSIITVSSAIESDDSKPEEVVDLRSVQAGLLKKAYARYFMAVKRVVNPGDALGVAIYGGAGADVAGFLLSTNIPEAYFVSDYRGLTKEELSLFKNKIYRYDFVDSYKDQKNRDAYTSVLFLSHADDIQTGLAIELSALGVDLSKVDVDSEDGHPRIKFRWAYAGAKEQTYSITFINADITRPDQYPSLLKKVLQNGIDLYYQRAGLGIPSAYSDFIPVMYNHMKSWGYFVTDDYPWLGDYSRSDRHLRVDTLFPDELSVINIPNQEHLEKDILRGEESPAIPLFYGWRLTIRRKPASSALAREDVPTLCLTPDSLITLADGSQKPLIALKPFVDLRGLQGEVEEGDMVLSLNEAIGKLEPHRVLALLDMGIKPVYQITTASGKQLKTTLTHPYLTKNGWRELKDIKVGEEVAVVSESADSNAVLLNYGQTSQKLFLRDRREKLIGESYNLINRKKINSKENDSAVRGNWIPDDVSKISIPGNEDKRVSFDNLVNFLVRGLGIYISYIKNMVALAFEKFSQPAWAVSINEEFHRGLNNRESNFFFVGKKSGVENAGLNIFGSNQAEFFRNSFAIHTLSQSLKDNIYRGAGAFNAGFPMLDILRGGYTLFNNLQINHFIYPPSPSAKDSISFYLSQDNLQIIFESIISIDCLGNLPVYDIEVEATHNFIAGGIVAHNTSQQERGSGATANSSLKNGDESANKLAELIETEPRRLEQFDEWFNWFRRQRLSSVDRPVSLELGTGIGIANLEQEEFLYPHPTIEWAQQFPDLQIFAVDRVIPYAAVRIAKRWGLFNAQGKLIAVMAEWPPDYTRVAALGEEQVNEWMRNMFNALYQSGLNMKKGQSDSPERIKLDGDAEIIFKPFELYTEKKGIKNIVFIPADFNDLARVKELEGVKFDFGRMFNVTRYYEPEAAARILDNLSGFFKAGAVLVDGGDVGHTDIMFSAYTKQQKKWEAGDLWFLWSMFRGRAPQDEIIFADIVLPALVRQNPDIAKKILKEFKEISGITNSQGGYYHGEDFKNFVIEKLQEKKYNVLPQPKDIRHLIGIGLPQWLSISASPLQDTSVNHLVDKDLGGVDFIRLPIVSQPEIVPRSPMANSPVGISGLNLDEEWAQIQNMLNAGIRPSSERLREYALASSALKSEDYGQEMDKLLGCIADILRLEEERVLPIEPPLREMLSLLESDKPPDELQSALSRISVLPKRIPPKN